MPEKTIYFILLKQEPYTLALYVKTLGEIQEKCAIGMLLCAILYLVLTTTKPTISLFFTKQKGLLGIYFFKKYRSIMLRSSLSLLS